MHRGGGHLKTNIDSDDDYAQLGYLTKCPLNLKKWLKSFDTVGWVIVRVVFSFFIFFLFALGSFSALS